MSKTEDKVKYSPDGRVKGLLYSLILIQIVTAVVMLINLKGTRLVPSKYYGIAVSAEVIFALLVIVIKRNKFLAVISALLSVVIIVVNCVGIYYIYKTNDTINKITNKSVEVTNTVQVFVLNDNKADDIKDALDYKFVAAKKDAEDSIDKVIENIKKEYEKDINVKNEEDFIKAIDSLYNEEYDALIINKAYIDILDGIDGYSDFDKRTKCIYTYIVKEEEETTTEEATTKKPKKPFNITKDTFNVYISGIDVEGDVSVKSRSDVNIIASVNPKKHRILLLSTPRDFYVPLSISGGSKDKLTHAGLYGVNVSKDTLAMLYDINIRYYVRMNFTGFRNIVNALGGIDVYSEYSFSSKGHYYQQGYNKLDGEAALWFARERKTFSSGDNQRGKNQMEVIKAVIDKAQSSAILSNYTQLLDSVSNCMETNMSSDEIAKLVNMQTNSKAKWKVVNYSVTGSGSSQYTYTVPGMRAYVMIPDMNTVETAKDMLKKLKKGKKLTQN
ncbi:MAG: LytR family transcriptional regulator [Lachnospiraceae bacterium]|nr:LytR family transcriptional regulator [Lachnospiraceae bacterium]